MIRRRTITSYEWHVATGNETVVLLDCVKSFFRRLELLGGTEQLTTTGKNLFDIKKASDASNYITTETLAKIDITAAIVFDVKKNTNYCLSVSGKTEQPSINFNIANDVQRKSIFNKLKTEETLNSLDSGKIYVGFSGGDTELNVIKLSQEYFDIQLEEASSKTPYEPYTGLKPSPSPEYPQEIKSAGKYDEASGKYLIDVKVTGKNLLPKEIVLINNNNNDAETIIYDEENHQYILQMKENNTNQVVFMFYLHLKKGIYTIRRNIIVDGVLTNKKDIVVKNANTNVSLVNKYDGYYSTFEVPEDMKVLINAGDYTGKKNKNAIIYDFQLEMGDKVTDYEPYREPQTLTLTSDRPITKWDRLVEQGGQYGWLYGSKIYVVTGNEVFESRDGYNIESYTNRFFILNDLLKENDVLKPLAYMKCLRNVQYVYFPNIFEEGFETNINQFHIKLSNDRVGILASDDHAVRTAKFSGYMKKIHKNGNPIEILYATTDTVFFPLSQEEQTQLRNLHSYNGTTNIMVDSGEIPCGINVEYKTKS